MNAQRYISPHHTTDNYRKQSLGKDSWKEPPTRKGLTAPVHLPAAVQFSVSVFYSEIPQVISLDSPKLIDLPGFGQEILVLLGFEDIHGSDLRGQVMDDLLQVWIHRHMLYIVEPEDSVSTAFVTEESVWLTP